MAAIWVKGSNFTTENMVMQHVCVPAEGRLTLAASRSHDKLASLLVNTDSYTLDTKKTEKIAFLLYGCREPTFFM